MIDQISVIGVELLRAPVRLTQVAEVVLLPQVLEQHVLVKKPRPTTTINVSQMAKLEGLAATCRSFWYLLFLFTLNREQWDALYYNRLILMI